MLPAVSARRPQRRTLLAALAACLLASLLLPPALRAALDIVVSGDWPECGSCAGPCGWGLAGAHCTLPPPPAHWLVMTVSAPRAHRWNGRRCSALTCPRSRARGSKGQARPTPRCPCSCTTSPMCTRCGRAEQSQEWCVSATGVAQVLARLLRSSVCYAPALHDARGG